MLLINKTKEQVTLEIANADNQRDSVNLQPQGRINLPEGWQLVGSKLEQYKQIVQIVS